MITNGIKMIINCPEYGRQMSSTSGSRCLSCGYKVPDRARMIALLIILAMIWITLAAFLL